jgi:hypothetical protein
MAKQATGSSDTRSASEPIPFMQRLLDSPLLLLFIGVAMPTLLYTLWGVMEIIAIPLAK